MTTILDKHRVIVRMNAIRIVLIGDQGHPGIAGMCGQAGERPCFLHAFIRSMSEE